MLGQSTTASQKRYFDPHKHSRVQIGGKLPDIDRAAIRLAKDLDDDACLIRQYRRQELCR